MTTRTKTSLLTLVAVFAFPLLTGANGPGCGGEVSIGDDKGECPTSACGAMPALACADGTPAYTGKCLAKTDGTCAWETHDCGSTTPPKECSPCAIPDIACADGTIPYTGKCYLDKAGACTPEYKGCGGKTCTTCEVPTIACADGSPGPYDGCELDPSGKCVAHYVGCATDKCTDAQCGPIPPVAPCAGGKGPDVTCNRHADGKCGWDVSACPVDACSKVTSYPTACMTAADCTFGIHTINCCGSTHAMGFNKSAASSFAADEKACDATYPACGCAAFPTVDDFGKQGTEFAVDCQMGVCTTHVTKGI
jgi:hypothetical protein